MLLFFEKPTPESANLVRERNLLWFFRRTTKNRKINLIEKKQVDSSKKEQLDDFCL